MIKRKKKSEEQRLKDIEEYEKQWDMFKEIWNERPHRSEISGKSLGSIINSLFFDHLLEKSTYPQFKYEKDNICLINSEEHQLKNNGFPLPRHRELIEKAKKQFLNQ